MPKFLRLMGEGADKAWREQTVISKQRTAFHSPDWKSLSYLNTRSKNAATAALTFTELAWRMKWWVSSGMTSSS